MPTCDVTTLCLSFTVIIIDTSEWWLSSNDVKSRDMHRSVYDVDDTDVLLTHGGGMPPTKYCRISISRANVQIDAETHFDNLNAGREKLFIIYRYKNTRLNGTSST